MVSSPTAGPAVTDIVNGVGPSSIAELLFFSFMFGAVLTKLLPEKLSNILNTNTSMQYICAGILIFFVVAYTTMADFQATPTDAKEWELVVEHSVGVILIVCIALFVLHIARVGNNYWFLPSFIIAGIVAAILRNVRLQLENLSDAEQVSIDVAFWLEASLYLVSAILLATQTAMVIQSSQG